jgi:hypothetical protein
MTNDIRQRKILQLFPDGIAYIRLSIVALRREHSPSRHQNEELLYSCKMMAAIIRYYELMNIKHQLNTQE